jgi:ubiquinone/menaquinone biosynthesis C-methylase UbiE
VGIDAAPRAIARARSKAEERGSSAQFEVADALELEALGRVFRTAIDSGLFHVFDDADRDRFARSLASVVETDGRYHLLCFSEHEPGTWDPRRVSQAEIRGLFVEPDWRAEEIAAAGFQTNFEGGDVRAWRAQIVRL